jgi:hypothetical protein
MATLRNASLLRLDPTAYVARIVAAAMRRGVPLAVLDVRSHEVAGLYRHKLVLVRPDQHVAWRGNEEPADAVELIHLVRGATRATSRNVRDALAQRRPRDLSGLTA